MMTTASSTATWPTASDLHVEGDRGGFLLICNPGARGVELFQQALIRRGLPPGRLLPWLDLIERRTTLAEAVPPGWTVRLESPGRDFAVERALLIAGADEPDELDSGGRFERMTAEAARKLEPDRGRIHCSRQWYLGFRRVLRGLEPGAHVMSDPGEVAVMFDKPACHARLERVGIPLPPAFEGIDGFDGLRAAMRESGCAQVFVKLAHGSSASGTVAYRTDGARHRAYTTTEVVEAAEGLRLYNNRRVRVLDSEREIARLVDALCRHHVQVEEWLPRAGIEGHTFDLRMVVIGGRAAHSVVRKSRTPMTNLHLLNPRGDLRAVQSRMSEDAWRQAIRTCEAAMRSFPRSLYGGVDLAVLGDFRHHAVLEVNAFGDLLPGYLHDGRETYDLELDALFGRVPS